MGTCPHGFDEYRLVRVKLSIPNMPGCSVLFQDVTLQGSHHGRLLQGNRTGGRLTHLWIPPSNVTNDWYKPPIGTGWAPEFFQMRIVRDNTIYDIKSGEDPLWWGDMIIRVTLEVVDYTPGLPTKQVLSVGMVSQAGPNARYNPAK